MARDLHDHPRIMSTHKTQRDFTKTKAALAAYDKADEEFGAWAPRLSNHKCLEMLDELDAMALAVGRAFCEETSDINSMSCATVVKPGPWVRKTIGYDNQGGDDETGHV